MAADRCPAKSTAEGRAGMPVLDHCRAVGAVARELVRRMHPSTNQHLPSHAATLAAVHDAGKVSPGYLKRHFQTWLTKHCPQVARCSRILFEEQHGIVGEAALRAWAQAHGLGESWCRWGLAVGAHHGVREEPMSEPCGKYGGRAWCDQRLILIDRLAAEFGQLVPVDPTDDSLAIAAGLTSVADWVGSNEDWFATEGLPPEADLPELAREALDGAGFTVPEVRGGLGFADLFPGYAPNEIQNLLHLAATEPGLFILEAPTGLGKTEAALYAAYRLIAEGHNRGVYFALPTRLTSNRVHERVGAFVRRAFGEEAGAQLVHGQAWIADRTAGGEELLPGGAWFSPLKRSLLYPFGVGTIDQALLAVLNVRHAFVRSFGLAGKVVILDEVHSYDAYTGTLLDRLVERLLSLECSVIVLSATLTEARRQDLIGPTMPTNDGYPLITSRIGREVRATRGARPTAKRVACRYEADDCGSLAEVAAQLAGRDRNVLWINNTVARSQAAYRAARSAVMEGTAVGLLHSRFPAWRREQLEGEWLARLGKDRAPAAGTILVATQVVEQSVDIDADFLITDLAPTDMILQRMGRLWRHERPGRAGRPECIIVGGELHGAADGRGLKRLLGPSRWVYAPYVLWRAYHLLRYRSEVLIPDQVRQLLEATYSGLAPDDPEWACELLADLDRRRSELASRALGMTRHDIPTMSDDDEASPTRWSDRPMVSALLVKACDPVGDRAQLVLSCGITVAVKKGEHNLRSARLVHKSLVSLPVFPDFRDIGRASRWLRSCVHGPVVVLLIDEEGRLRRVDGTPTSYAYDDAMGVRRLERAQEAVVDDYLEDIYESDW